MGNNHFQWGNYYFRSTNGILNFLMGNYQWDLVSFIFELNPHFQRVEPDGQWMQLMLVTVIEGTQRFSRKPRTDSTKMRNSRRFTQRYSGIQEKYVHFCSWFLTLIWVESPWVILVYGFKKLKSCTWEKQKRFSKIGWIIYESYDLQYFIPSKSPPKLWKVIVIAFAKC